MTADVHERPVTAALVTEGPREAEPDTTTRLAWLRTQLAVQRTLMAWNRTCLSLIGFGFTIYQFLANVQAAAGEGARRPLAPRTFGLAFLLVGTLGTLVALWQYYLAERYLRGPEFKEFASREGLPHASLTATITVFLAMIGVATSAWIMLDG